MILLILGLISVIVLSYWNGANDVSKTISTIVGGRVANYKKAVIIGAIFNGIGTFLALFFAQAIFKIFTNGILKETAVTNSFTISIIIGAMLWIIIATRIGMPVSTTHSIVGAIVFLGLYVFSFAGIMWASVLFRIIIPLILSPVLSFMLAYSLFWLYSKNKKFRNLKIINSKKHLNNAHWISCAASSFARGMNDGPKFVALAAIFLISSKISPNFSIRLIIFAIVALAMGMGGIIHGMKVTNTLSYKITKLGHIDGFIANLITSVLVTSGASFGLPMSTTHVSSFAIIGIGLRKSTSSINWNTVKDMALSWLVTLPLSGIFSILSYSLLKTVGA